MTDDLRPIAIIGGLGKTGRRVADRLLALGHQVRAVSRSTTPMFDWDVPESWAGALAGTRAAYVTFQPDLSVPHATDSIARLAHVAREQGLEQIVLLSGRGEQGAQRAEKALAQAGIGWTVIRASWFMQNFSESFLAEAVQAGVVALPVDAVREPFVSGDDIADIAAAVLTGRAAAGQVYEVTGPTALTFAEAVALIGHASGRSIAYHALSTPEFRQELHRQGLPEALVEMLVDLFTVTLDGRNSRVTDGVARALGRQPTSFAEYAAGAFSAPVMSSVAA